MKLIKFIYNFYSFDITLVILLGLFSAYLDALAISELLSSEDDYTKPGLYIFAGALLRLFFIYKQARLGALITTDLGINIIKEHNSKFNSKNSEEIELSSLVLLKAVNFNNYVIRPVLSLFINGITVLMLISPVIYAYIIFSIYALIPIFLVYLFYIIWFKRYLNKLSKGLSLDQDMSGFLISSLQSNSLDINDNFVLSKLSMFSYQSLQKRTAIIYFLSQSPKSWFEIGLLLLIGLVVLVFGEININISILGGLTYTFYRIMTPLNSVVQAAVSMKSFNDSSMEVMNFAMSKNYIPKFLNKYNNKLKLTISNDLSNYIKENPTREKLFLDSIELLKKQLKNNFTIEWGEKKK